MGKSLSCYFSILKYYNTAMEVAFLAIKEQTTMDEMA